jgi:hypothetical protein
MKTFFRFAVFILIISGPARAVAAHPTPAADGALAPGETLAAGTFVGTWRNETDSGKLRLSFKQEGAAWSAEGSFTFQEAEIPARVTKLKVDGSKIELVLAWVVQESPGQSRMVGELSGVKIEGTFESETPDGTSSGTWTVTRS